MKLLQADDNGNLTASNQTTQVNAREHVAAPRIVASDHLHTESLIAAGGGNANHSFQGTLCFNTNQSEGGGKEDYQCFVSVGPNDPRFNEANDRVINLPRVLRPLKKLVNAHPDPGSKISEHEQKLSGHDGSLTNHEQRLALAEARIDQHIGECIVKPEKAPHLGIHAHSTIAHCTSKKKKNTCNAEENCTWTKAGY